MITHHLYQFNIYTAFGGLYTNGGIYANTNEISPNVTPVVEIVDNDGAFILDNDGAQIIDN